MTETVSDERLRELAQGYETWSKTNSSRPQIDKDTASALRELLALRTLRTPPQNTDGEAVAWPPAIGTRVTVEFEVVSHCSVGEPAWVGLSAPGILTDIEYRYRSALVPASTLSAMKAERDALALDTKALEAVKVKPLAWVVMDDAGERSITICGMYAISPKGEKLTLTGMPGRGLGRFESMEDAKAAAQKDYAIRILSAIDLSATPSRNDILESTVDSLRAAVFEYQQRGILPGAVDIMEAQIAAILATLQGDAK